MDDWLSRTAAGVTWRVAPAWADALLDGGGLRLAEWQAQGRLTTVKAAPHRTIYRADLPAGAVFIKHYPLNDLRAVLRQLVRPPKAAGEAATARALTARGIPTVTPLAVGRTPRGCSWLVTRALDGVIQLNAFVETVWPTLPPGRRPALIEALAELLARFHAAGGRHLDLHAGNVLVRPGEPPELFLIDLHEVRLAGRPLSWAATRANLVLLNRWFVQRCGRADRRRFWRAYVRRRRDWHLTPAEERRRARELETATWASCLAFWRGRDRRCLTTNRYFYRQKGPGAVAWAVRDLPTSTLRTLLADPDAPFTAPGSRVLKHSKSSTVAALDLPAGGTALSVIYKRIMPTQWYDLLLHLFRRTPALRSWVNGHRLIDAGLPTPRPLAVLHRRRFGLTRECYLITERLTNVAELHHHAATLGPGPRRQALTEAVARLIRALHDRRLTHRDLKAANLLVNTAPERPGDVRLWLIDLVGVERWRRLPMGRRVQNLARLHASFHAVLGQAEKLRFLGLYLRRGLHGAADWRAWWRAIAAATARKIAQNRRRGRPLA